jgi:NNP family nitrate/nitrite transporter-like MFS transporter
MSFWLIALGMAAGLYLPSGIATITELVSPKDWGKAIAIHELAPNLGFAIAPLLTEVLMGWFAWRQILMLLGLASILMGILFALFGKGGASPGEAPNFKILRSISADRSFWIMMVVFSLGLGCGLGLYGMIPLYLVSERGMERAWANTLLALSRILTTAMPIVSGWATDRLGSKNTLKVVLLTTSLLTAMLGLMPGSWVVLIVFLQPIAATSFFPPGFAALSQWAPQNTKNVAVSLTTPIASFLGSGAVPAGLGFMGEVGSFSMGFVILGGLLLGGALLVRYLKFQE